jgi:hypothetical protein
MLPLMLALSEQIEEPRYCYREEEETGPCSINTGPIRSLDLKEEEDDATNSCPSLKEAAAIVKEGIEAQGLVSWHLDLRYKSF